ncbi:hypothetical protein [Burkholderia multivorans]|uniref:hypothetical protein n=1 Tax=Burkholderia multivorans TaxID=87883 RepID=UPI00207C45B3|nr:hypothetical protein [Burkholderia multivorans]MCO1449902.1 hypothetical protein [Burkholderia multivorans]
MNRSNGKWIIAGLTVSMAVVGLVAVYAARERQIARLSKVATAASQIIATSLKADRTLGADYGQVFVSARDKVWESVIDARRRSAAAESILDKESLNRDTDDYLSSASNVFAKISGREALLRDLAFTRDLMASAKRDLNAQATGPTAEYANNLLRATQNDELPSVFRLPEARGYAAVSFVR